MRLRPFHLAVPVDDLEAAREFYVAVLGCRTGRESDHWIDFDLFGHQVVVHRAEAPMRPPANPVDGEDVPAFHFGVVLDMDTWKALVDRLRGRGVEFLIEPQIRFEGQVGEQATCFFRDPAGNAMEFKAFADPEELFRR